MSDDLQLLLDAARAAPPVPTADAAERLRRAVLVTGLAGAGAGGLAKPAAVATRALLAKTVLGLAIIAVTGGAVLAVMHRAPPAVAPKASSPPAVAVVTPSIATTEPAVPAEPQAVTGVRSRPVRALVVAPPAVRAAPEGLTPAPVESDAPAVTSAPVTALPTAPVRAAPSIAAEIKALDETLAAIDAGRWAQALDMLARYRASFPQGALATEARTLEVLALCGLGRADDARALGRGLLRDAATSPTISRLRHSCIAP